MSVELWMHNGKRTGEKEERAGEAGPFKGGRCGSFFNNGQRRPGLWFLQGMPLVQPLAGPETALISPQQMSCCASAVTATESRVAQGILSQKPCLVPVSRVEQCVRVLEETIVLSPGS